MTASSPGYNFHYEKSQHPSSLSESMKIIHKNPSSEKSFSSVKRRGPRQRLLFFTLLFFSILFFSLFENVSIFARNVSRNQNPVNRISKNLSKTPDLHFSTDFFSDCRPRSNDTILPHSEQKINTKFEHSFVYISTSACIYIRRTA